MNREEFLGLIEDPYSLGKKEIETVEELLREFPYVPSLHFLHARGLHNLDHVQSAAALKKAAAYAGDRNVLYRLIMQPSPAAVVDITEEPAAVSEASLISEQVSSVPEPVPAPPDRPEETAPAEEALAVPVIQSRDHHTFTEWLRQTHIPQHFTFAPAGPVEKPVTEIKPQIEDELDRLYRENIFHLESLPGAHTIEFRLESKQQDLIDRFLTAQPVIRPSGDKQQNTDNKARKSAEDAGEFVSETLALIYLTQKHYDKAIMVYEKLSLKFPEKKTYFASLIQKIKSDHQLS